MHPTSEFDLSTQAQSGQENMAMTHFLRADGIVDGIFALKLRFTVSLISF